MDKTTPDENPAEDTASFERLVAAFIGDGYATVSTVLLEEYCNVLGGQFDNDCFGLRELLTMGTIQELSRSPQILRLTRAVLGDSAFAVSGTFFNKTPAANWRVPWHQDRMIKVQKRFDSDGWGPWSTKCGVIHVQPPASVISGVLAIRLHLDDCPSDNGALRVIPGSHRFGFLDPKQTASLLTQSETVCPVPMGGAFLMSPLLLHSSSPSNSPRSRRVIHLEFASYDLPEPFQWRYRVA
jgi:ectoine hydroxylase-related dioxygenase (phytanoyl-CoA dioxygenase family)